MTLDMDTISGRGERRGGFRRRMYRHAQVLSLDRTSMPAIECTLRNLSHSGARLCGPKPSISRIPDQFYLVPPGQLRIIHCKVVWKSDDAVGVSFLSDLGPLAKLMICTDAVSRLRKDHAPNGPNG